MRICFSVRTLKAVFVANALVAGIAGWSAPSQAGTTAGTIAVSLNVSAACAVNGGTITNGALGQVGAIAFADQPGVFGDVDAAMVATGGGGGLSILCSPGLTPAMTIGAGAHDSQSLRHMAFGSNQVAYHLYSDSARSNELTIGQQVSLGTATTTAFTLPIYAKVNSGGVALPAGAYADTVQVTLSW